MKAKNIKEKELVNVGVCPYCYLVVKQHKLIKCSICDDEYCYDCLTEINKDIFLCPECLRNFVKENVSFAITRNKNYINDKKEGKI